MDVCGCVLYTYYEPARSVCRQGLDANRGEHIGYAFVQDLVRNGEAYHFYLIMINLFPHNLTAYESAVEMLAETGKAAKPRIMAFSVRINFQNANRESQSGVGRLLPE